MTTTTLRTPANRADDQVHGRFELGMRCKPHAQREILASRARVEQWVCNRGLTTSAESFTWYRTWDTAAFAGARYPHASAAGMDLVGRFMAVSILLDDSLDELESAADCARGVRPFLDIIGAGGHLTMTPGCWHNTGPSNRQQSMVVRAARRPVVH